MKTKERKSKYGEKIRNKRYTPQRAWWHGKPEEEERRAWAERLAKIREGMGP